MRVIKLCMTKIPLCCCISNFETAHSHQRFKNIRECLSNKLISKIKFLKIQQEPIHRHKRPVFLIPRTYDHRAAKITGTFQQNGLDLHLPWIKIPICLKLKKKQPPHKQNIEPFWTKSAFLNAICLFLKCFTQIFVDLMFRIINKISLYSNINISQSYTISIKYLWAITCTLIIFFLR